MGENSKIEWTDHTFNIVWGCTRVSPACQNCYAEAFSHRLGKDLWGPGKDRQTMSESYWRQPLKWNRQAEKARVRRRVFCSSMADVFEDHKTVNFERHKLFLLIEDTPHLDWLLLTKRPENIGRMLPRAWREKPRHNVWLGTTVENQEWANKRVPYLLEVPAWVRFLSCEPLLGAVDLRRIEHRICNDDAPIKPVLGNTETYNALRGERIAGRIGYACNKIDWVIVGGESGKGARPMHPQWARDLRDQCKAAGVAYHFKQWGEFLPLHGHREFMDLPEAKENRQWVKVEGETMVKVGKAAAGRLLDGRTWDELPVEATTL